MNTAKKSTSQLNDRLCLAKMFENDIWFRADKDQGKLATCEPDHIAATFPSDECLHLPEGSSHQDALDLLRQEKPVMMTVGQARTLFGVHLAKFKRAT